MISLPFQKYQLGQCVINCHDMTMSTDGKTIQLPAKVFEFLKLLLLHAGETVTKELAINAVWLGNVEVGKRGTGNAIWQLRKTLIELGLEPEKYFKTITKVGYQLLQLPERIESQTSKLTAESISLSMSQHSLVKPLMLGLVVAITMVYLSILLWQDMANIQTSVVPVVSTRITNFEGVEEQAAISSDGRYLAFQWRREKKQGQLYIKEIGNPGAPLRQVSMTADKESSPSWSPDGLSLAYLRLNRQGECSVHVRELITNRDKIIDTGCMSIGFMHALEWSPDGQWLAYTKLQGDRIAVVSYHFDSETISEITHPEAGEEDLLMTWSADSKRLVFVRSVEMKAQLLVKSLGGAPEVIVDGESSVIGLEWDHLNNQIYFNAQRDGNFIIQRLDMQTRQLVDFHRDDTISSLALNYVTRELYYSRHLSQEHITIRSLTDGSVLSQLASSSRDMYGQAIAATGGILFMSNRSGAWELWLKQDKGSRQLTQAQGLLGIPAVSPDGERFVVAMKPASAQDYGLYMGDLASGELTRLDHIDGDIRNPAFSNDGAKLYFSSNVAGQWGIYRYTLASGELESIITNGKYAVEDDRGGIYYSKDNLAGIFYQPADGGEGFRVTADLAAGDWGSFFYLDGLYYLKRTDKQDIVIRQDELGVQHIAFSLPAASIKNERSLSLTTDGKVVVTMLGINDADIYSIPLP